jgi:hypothetical protein
LALAVLASERLNLVGVWRVQRRLAAAALWLQVPRAVAATSAEAAADFRERNDYALF